MIVWSRGNIISQFSNRSALSICFFKMCVLSHRDFISRWNRTILSVIPRGYDICLNLSHVGIYHPLPVVGAMPNITECVRLNIINKKSITSLLGVEITSNTFNLLMNKNTRDYNIVSYMDPTQCWGKLGRELVETCMIGAVRSLGRSKTP